MSAYAIKVDDHILVSSVSPRQIGAMVNYICTNHGILIGNGTSDEQVQAVFEQCASRDGAVLVAVDIKEAVV